MFSFFPPETSGVRFGSNDECHRIGKLVERSIQSCCSQLHSQQSSKSGGDLISILTKAQETANNSVAGNYSATQPTNTPANPNMTSPSVINFFAAAKPTTQGIPPILKRMMSEPVHVDQIEKEQRTPQDSTSNLPHPSAFFKRIPSPKPSIDVGTSPFANFHDTPDTASSSSRINAAFSELSVSQMSMKDMLKNNDPTAADQTKPSLMLPTMFSLTNISTNTTGTAMSPTVTKDKQSSSNTSQTEQPAGHFNLEPLTHNQLLQAMSYLIRNDKDFIKKLHEAYLHSLNEMLS